MASFVKLYLQVHIKELYDGIIKPPNLGRLNESIGSDGNLIISDFNLCELFPPEANIMPKQRRDLCGCEFTFSNITTRLSKYM